MESHGVGFIFVFGVLFSVVYATTPCDFPAIFNFGDSNSDTGEASAVFGQQNAPNGESYFGGPAGRLSDGRLIIDFIAESLGMPYLNPFLKSVGSNFSHGANFACIGVPIRPDIKTPTLNLDVQIKQFNDFHKKSQRFNNNGVFRGLLPRREDFSRALYTLDIGHNDMMNLVGMSNDDLATNVTDILNRFKIAFKNIYDNGGRSFWIHNVGPLGCLATHMQDFIAIGKFDEVGCSTHINRVVQYYNGKLKETVVQLRKEFSLAAITYVDIYTVKYTLFSQANEHGFENPLRVCCGYGDEKYNVHRELFCGKKETINGTEVFVGKCKDPSRSINWDGVHLTEAANKWVFDQIVDGSFSDPPIPIKMACHKHH